ncbi:MAG: AI-2E family transporter, partial [Myxococcales bacterium]|nr:AI-2E family transporter [Myxococcales bacterium]
MAIVGIEDGRVFTRRIGRTLLMTVLVGAVVFVAGWAYHVLLTVFAGAILAVLLHGIASTLTAHARVGYRVALALVVVGLAVLLALALWFVGPALASQIDQLVHRVPAAAAQWSEKLKALP